MHPALEIKAALIDASLAAIPNAVGRWDGDQDKVLVCNGHPGLAYPNDVVSFGRFLWPEAAATLGTRRTRDLELRLYAVISIARPGGPEQESIAEARCLELSDYIAEYVRVTDPTLGGRAYWCFRTNYDSDGSTDPDLISQGRLIEATVEFTAKARITS